MTGRQKMKIRYQRTPDLEGELHWLCTPKRLVLSVALSVLIVMALLCYKWPEKVGLQPHQPATASQYILQKDQYVQLSPRAYPPYKVCQHLDVVLEGPQEESPGTTIWERQANGQGRDEVLVTVKGKDGKITGTSLDPTVWFMGPNNSLAIHTYSHTGGSMDGTYVVSQNGKDTGLYAVTVKGGAKACNESAVYLQVEKMIAYPQSQLGRWVSVQPNQALVTTATQGHATIICDMKTISESLDNNGTEIYKAATVSWSPDTRLQIDYNHTFVIGEEWFSAHNHSLRPGTQKNNRAIESNSTTTTRTTAGRGSRSLRKRRAVDITTWQTEQRYQNDPNSFVSIAAKVAYSQKSQQHKECYVCSLLPTNSIEGFPLMGAPITACDLCKLMNTATNSECQNITLVQEPEWSDLGCQQVKKSVTCPSPPKITPFFRVIGQAMWCIEGTGNDTSPFLGNLECPPLTQDYFEEKSCANNQSSFSFNPVLLSEGPKK